MIYRFLCVVILVLSFSCNKKKVYPNVKLFGHAGMGLNIPNSIFISNSEESIALALSFSKLSGVELDVRMSKDAKLWCYHEDKLEGYTNSFGCIEDKTYSDLKNVTFNSFHNESLFLIDSIALNNSREYFFDLKLFNACSNELINIDTLKNLLIQLKSHMDFKLIISDINRIDFFKHEFNCFLSIESSKINSSLISDSLIDGFVIRNNEVTSQYISEISDYGKKIVLYDIRSNSGNRSAFNKLPYAILTDDLRSAIGYLP